MEVAPNKEELLHMEIGDWLKSFAERHKMPLAELRGLSNSLNAGFIRPYPKNFMQKEMMHPRLYPWLRDHSIKKFGSVIGSSTPPMKGVMTVQDLRTLFMLAESRNPLEEPWIWLIGKSNNGVDQRELIQRFETMLETDALLN